MTDRERELVAQLLATPGDLEPFERRKILAALHPPDATFTAEQPLPRGSR